MNKTPTTLIIMDGFGLRKEPEGNAVAAADTLEAKQAAATNASNAMSQKVYNTTLKMYNKLQAKTAARAWVSSLLH